MKANVITLVMLAVALVWLLMHAYLVEWDPVKICGAVVAGVSVVLLVAARVQLGASFSVGARARRLVTTGIYARIRNPIYVFGALALAGMAMVLGNWVMLVLVAILIPVQRIRARREEAVLAEAFGEEYARYKAQTWF